MKWCSWTNYGCCTCSYEMCPHKWKDNVLCKDTASVKSQFVHCGTSLDYTSAGWSFCFMLVSDGKTADKACCIGFCRPDQLEAPKKLFKFGLRWVLLFLLFLPNTGKHLHLIIFISERLNPPCPSNSHVHLPPTHTHTRACECSDQTLQSPSWPDNSGNCITVLCSGNVFQEFHVHWPLRAIPPTRRSFHSELKHVQLSLSTLLWAYWIFTTCEYANVGFQIMGRTPHLSSYSRGSKYFHVTYGTTRGCKKYWYTEILQYFLMTVGLQLDY